ncbi:MAG: hypothetical protein ABTD50_09630 [Polyangiaceae bacterium]|jgi:hypothetical protein
MPSRQVIAGETWESIAAGVAVTVPELLLANGCDPDDPPPDPEVGSVVFLPRGQRAYAVSPGNIHPIASGSKTAHTLRMQLYDDDGNVMTNVRYSVGFFGHTLRGTSPDGWVTIAYPSATCASVTVDWGDATDGSDAYRYEVTLLTENYQGEFEDKIAVSSGSGYMSHAG